MALPSIQPGTVYYVIEWIIRLGAVVVVPRARGPAASNAWLLLIFFLPIPGLILFLAIGQRRFPRARTERFQALRVFFQNTAARLKTAPLDPATPTDIARL